VSAPLCFGSEHTLSGTDSGIPTEGQQMHVVVEAMGTLHIADALHSLPATTEASEAAKLWLGTSGTKGGYKAKSELAPYPTMFTDVAGGITTLQSSCDQPLHLKVRKVSLETYNLGRVIKERASERGRERGCCKQRRRYVQVCVCVCVFVCQCVCWCVLVCWCVGVCL
jgi:hypothetical protein